ncbi:hypothetical protein BsWGS_08886 [Bradybaena similaris]
MANESPPDDGECRSETTLYQKSSSDLPGASASTEHNQQTPPCSNIGVKIVITTVAMLFSMAIIPAGPLISQYLINRLSRGQNLNNTSASYNQCDKDANDSSVTQANELQATVSTLIMYYSYASSVPGILSGLIIGAYSDALGRRMTLLLPLFGVTVRLIITVFIMKYDLDLRLFYLAYGVDGLSGTGFVVLIAFCAIVADTNETKVERILWLTIINVLSSISTAASSILSGIAIKELGYFQTSVFLAVLCALCFLIPLVFLRETKPNQEVRTLNLCKNVRKVFGFFLFDGTRWHKLTFIICLSMFFFAVINEFGVVAIDTLYQLHRPFCWSSKLIGYYSALKTGGGYFLAMVLMAALKSRVKMEYIGILAAVSQGASFCFQAFVKTTWQFFLVPIVAIPGCLITSVIRGLMSSLARPESQGALFTSICIFEIVCQMAAYTVFSKVYAETVSTFPGAVYLCMMSFSTISCVLIILYLKVHKYAQMPVYEKIINAEEDNG